MSDRPRRLTDWLIHQSTWIDVAILVAIAGTLLLALGIVLR
jgi:hypothetical protein